jgi:hypothetical protein
MNSNFRKELLWLIILAFSTCLLFSVLFGTSVFIHGEFVTHFHDTYTAMSTATIATCLFSILSFVIYGIRMALNRCAFLWVNCLFLFFCTILIVTLINIPEHIWILLSGHNAEYGGWTVSPPVYSTDHKNTTLQALRTFSIIEGIKILQIALTVLWLIVSWLSLKMFVSKRGNLN